MSVAAVALGAKVLERHVTLDKSWKGSDHSASLDPSELAELVRSVRIVEQALGNGIKQMLPCEVPCHDKVSKCTRTHATLVIGKHNEVLLIGITLSLSL